MMAEAGFDNARHGPHGVHRRDGLAERIGEGLWVDVAEGAPLRGRWAMLGVLLGRRREGDLAAHDLRPQGVEKLAGPTGRPLRPTQDVGEADGGLCGTPAVHLEDVIAVLSPEDIARLPGLEGVHPLLEGLDNLAGSDVAQASPKPPLSFLAGRGVLGVAIGELGEGNALIERVCDGLSGAVGGEGIPVRRSNQNVADVDGLLAALI